MVIAKVLGFCMNGQNGGKLEAEDSPLWRTILLVWLLASVLLIAISWDGIKEFRFPDPDDTLRLVQVRDWIAGQSWFDLSQYRMNPPQGVEMHWSRLVDLPIAAIILLFKPILGQAAAEMVALISVPLLTLLILMAVMTRLTSRFIGREAAFFAAILVVISVPIVKQLQPMRIDHHGWQLVCAALALSGMLSTNARRGGLIAGAALSAWVIISIEGLPMVAATLAIACSSWLLGPHDDKNGMRMVSLAASLTVISAFLWIITRLPLGFTTFCDALSPIHIAVFAISAAGIVFTWKMARSLAVRLCGLAATAIAAIIVMLYIAPQCAGDAFGNLDPLVRFYWYNNVLEGRPIWKQSNDIITQILATPLVGIFATTILIKIRPDQREPILVYSGMVLASFIVSIFVQRAAGVASVMVIPAVAWLAHQLLVRARKINNFVFRIAGSVGAILLLAPSIVIMAVLPANQKIDDLNSKVKKATLSCTSAESIEKMAGAIALNGGGQNMLAPLDISPEILASSSMNVVASSHHRNRSGMHDVIAAFTSPPDVAKKIIAKRNIQYLVYCENLAEIMIYADSNKNNLAEQLIEDKIPPWLMRIDDGKLGAMHLFQITNEDYQK